MGDSNRLPYSRVTLVALAETPREHPLKHQFGRLLYPTLLSRLKVIRVPLYFLDDVLCQNLAFETAQRVIQRLAVRLTDH